MFRVNRSDNSYSEHEESSYHRRSRHGGLRHSVCAGVATYVLEVF